MRYLALFVVGGLLAGMAAAASLDLRIDAGSGLHDNARDLFRVLTAGMFFGAGLLRISRWRISGESHDALLGVAWVLFGSLTFSLSNIAGLVHGDEPAITLTPLTRVMATVVTITFIVMAMRTPEHRPQLKPGRLTMMGASLVVTGFAGLVVARQAFGASLDPSALVHFRLELVMANAWFAVAAAAAWHGRKADWAGRVAPLLTGLGMVGVMRSIAVYRLDSWSLALAAFGALIAAAALASATSDLVEATTHENGRLEAVKGALSRAENVHLAHEAWREELTHDARNAIMGLRGALVTLAKYDEQLDAATRDRLRAAVLGELGHLDRMVERTDDEALVDFEVADVLVPLVEAQRAAGLCVELICTPCQAVGRPGDVATVVRNLLVNAGRHSGGSSVTVRARHLGSQVEIHVEDRGRGVPQAQRAVLFERGARGEDSTGSGLGLYVARTLMRDQGGDIKLADRAGRGATFVVTLPSHPAAADTPKRDVPRRAGDALPQQRRQQIPVLHSTVRPS